jgi:hypothetical protein
MACAIERGLSGLDAIETLAAKNRPAIFMRDNPGRMFRQAGNDGDVMAASALIARLGRR